MCYTWVGSGLTCKHRTRLERLARDKHYNLFQPFVTYGQKMFDNIGPSNQFYITFLSSLSLTLQINRLERLSFTGVLES
jgi:hypothetical protein